jgi:hypothetical protein
MSALSEAFKELCAVCRPRPDQDESVLMAAASRLWKVLGEFPEPVAQTALDLWPRRSEWFPTEFELRSLLEEIASNAAREAQARGSVGGGKYREPVGNTVAFVEEVRKLRGPDYCKSWLAGGITCLFSANIVYTTGIGADRLDKDVGALAAQLGVKIVHDKECSEMLARYCNERQLSFDPKGRRR